MYFKNLDPLRGFLALLVVVFHVASFSGNLGLPNLPIIPLLERGPEAVLVFFSLSGYLIIGQLFDERHTTGRIAVKEFYLRRILRLYPVYYLVLFVGLLFYFGVLPTLGIAEAPDYGIGEALFWNIAFLPNVFSNLHDPGSILLILWSIGIEEQFYLLIAPIFAWVPGKRYLGSLIGFTIVYFIVFHLPSMEVLRNYIMVFFFMSAGGVVAILQRKGVRLFGTHRVANSIIYLLFALVFFTNLFHFEQDIYKHAAYLLIFNTFIPTLAHDGGLRITPNWALRLGKISYGIYMYHMIVINAVIFIGEKMFERGLPNAVVLGWNWSATLIGTIVLAYLSYEYYEKYFLRLKGKYRILGGK